MFVRITIITIPIKSLYSKLNGLEKYDNGRYNNFS